MERRIVAAAAADRLPPLPGQPGRQCLPLRALDRDLGAKQKDEMVEIAIEDDGPGIPEAMREKVFEPFVRLDEQPRGRATAASGSGLTIARDVVLSPWRRPPARQSRHGGLRAVLRLPA